MTTLSERLAEQRSTQNVRVVGREQRALNQSHPKGWEPGTAFDGRDYSITSVRPADQEADHADLLREWGFDPTVYHIREGSLQYRTWDANLGEGQVQRFRYYKANIDKGALLGDADLSELLKYIEKPYKPAKVMWTGDDAFVICLSDWQVGKGEGGGTPATVARLKRYLELAVKRIADLRKAGKPLGVLYILGLGDIIEQCFGHYAKQVFTVDLNRRDQEKVVRHLLVLYIKTLAPLFEKVVVVAVGGNHGENRGGAEGKAFTNDADNSDVSIFETIAERLSENQAYDHVSFMLPEDELSLCVNIAGVPVGLAHGHQFYGGGKLAQAKAKEWWKGQMFGMQAVADALILVSGHYHHYSVIEHGPRTHFQTPACDGGSKWFRDSSGEESEPGLLTFRVTQSSPTGWDSAEILRDREDDCETA